jgi:hypothetical protein
MNPVQLLYSKVEEFILAYPDAYKNIPNNISYLLTWYSCLTYEPIRKKILIGDIILDIDGVKNHLINFVKKHIPESEEDDKHSISCGHASKKELENIINNINHIKTHDDIIKLLNGDIDIYGNRLYVEDYVRHLIFNYLYYNNHQCPIDILKRELCLYEENIDINHFDEYVKSLDLRQQYEIYIKKDKKEKTIYYLGLLLNSDAVDLPDDLRKQLTDYFNNIKL